MGRSLPAVGTAGAKALCLEKHVQSGGQNGALGGQSGDSGLEVSWGGRLREALGGGEQSGFGSGRRGGPCGDVPEWRGLLDCF